MTLGCDSDRAGSRLVDVGFRELWIMSAVSVAIAAAVELTKLLRFLNDWLASDHDRPDPSLWRFVRNPAYIHARCARIWTGSRTCSVK